MRLFLFLLICLQLPLVQADKLIVGTTAENPPFSMIADSKDHFYGFDIDIMSEICKRIKSSCEFKPLIFGQLFNYLQENKIDLAIGAIVIMPMWQEQFLFSLPYLESDAQFITLKKSPIQNPSDITHKRIGVRQGTSFDKLAVKLYGDQITVITFKEIDDLIEGLSNNKVDAVLTNAAAARYWYANNSEIYKLIGAKIPTGEGYGIMSNLNQSKLMAKINQALLSMEADGSYLNIYSRYFDTTH